MAAPYTPPASFADLSPQAWQSYVASVDGRARQVFTALASGETPLRPGEVARLRSLTAGLRSAYRLSEDEARAAAWQIGSLSGKMRETLESTLGAVPGHAQQAVDGLDEWLDGKGYPRVGLPRDVLAGVVNRTQQNITHDWTRLADDVQGRVVESLRYAVTAGESIPDTVRAMRVGFADTAQWTAARAQNVARTEIADVMHTSTKRAMEEAQAPFWAWDATEDSRTCEICLTMHGRVFPMSEDMDSHQMCRCAQVPVFADELDKVNRDPVGGDIGYYKPLGKMDGGLPRGQLTKTANPGWRSSWKASKPTTGPAVEPKPTPKPKPTTPQPEWVPEGFKYRTAAEDAEEQTRLSYERRKQYMRDKGHAEDADRYTLDRHRQYYGSKPEEGVAAVVSNDRLKVLLGSKAAADPVSATRAIRKLDRMQAVQPRPRQVTAMLHDEAYGVLPGQTDRALGYATIGGHRMDLFAKSWASGPKPFSPRAFKMPVLLEGPTSQAEYTIAHEYGHLQDTLTNAQHSRLMARMPNDAMYELSTYGHTNSAEAVAECFAEWVLTEGKTTNLAARWMAKELKWTTMTF